jgi:hypothetical protein
MSGQIDNVIFDSGTSPGSQFNDGNIKDEITRVIEDQERLPEPDPDPSFSPSRSFSSPPGFRTQTQQL